MQKTKPCDDGAISVDEEGMYYDSDSLVALSDNSYNTDLTASSDSDIDSSDLEYDPDDEILAEDDKKFIHSHLMLMIHALMLIVFFFQM
jgi:hypothetical protein